MYWTPRFPISTWLTLKHPKMHRGRMIEAIRPIFL
jgi:hypothetical protein